MISSQLFQDLAECLGWKIDSCNQFQLGAYEDVLQFLGFLNIDISNDVFKLEFSAQKRVNGWKFNIVTLAEKIAMAKELDILIPGFGAELQLSTDLTTFNKIYMDYINNKKSL